MEPRISIITLGVSDLEKSTRFYRDGLGFPEYEEGSASITFFLLGNMMLALYPLEALTADSGSVQRENMPGGPHAFTIAHNVASRTDVDDVLREAESAGAQIVKPAAPTFWGGYSGYFTDPDGHLWEVAWNPYFPIE